MPSDPTPIALVTGSAGGIGAACIDLLHKQAFRTIGVDLKDADIVADLATAEGREAMVRQVGQLAPDGLDIVIAAAGVSDADPARIVSTNTFGAIATLEGLRPLLAKRAPASAIAISSTSAIEELGEAYLAVCLSGDEAKARAAAEAASPLEIYAGSKRALALWVRGAAVRPEWGGSGIALNAVAPGLVRTGMTAHLIDDPRSMAYLDQVTPRVTGGAAEPWRLAEAVVALATLQGGLLLGQVIFVDGGTTAIRVPDPFEKGRAGTA